jgi:hypothetical protein
VTPRIPSFDEPPPRLFDPETGAVTLRLYPFHREERHGQWPADIDVADATIPGSEFPLRPDSQPITVTLNAGMAPSEVGPQELIAMNNAWGDLSWWQWPAYAKTPLGWIGSFHVTFTRGWLSHLSLAPEAELTSLGFEGVDQVLREELGAPHELRKSGFRPRGWGRSILIHDDRLWTFPWGEVEFGHEGHHGELQIGVRWSTERL